ncbi:MAG: hypothetical protein OEZ39_10685 [Gammaproteobacteria bacterium]|nr:hypothetical protein [Gammaproteobacteria bacterium]MDH5652309.1 hypothetical protein [Gammaproteobacteria bacterium]
MQANRVISCPQLRYSLLMVALCLSLSVHANEISVFNLTGIEGDVGISYQSDELMQGQVHGAKTGSKLSTTREDINLLSRSYIYHPNLLNIEFGVGLSYVQNKLETTIDNTETDESLDSLNARLNFLDKKPYPITLYYNRESPMISPSLEERFIQENRLYGLNASVHQPLLPFSINVEAFHTDNEGSGQTRIVNDSSDQFIFRSYRAIGKDGFGQLTYHDNHRESAGGITSQPIFSTDITSKSTSLDTHFRFGAKKEFSMSNLLSWFEQDNLPVQKEFRFVPNLAWQHSRDFSTYYRLDFLDSKIESVQIRNTSAAMGGRVNFSETTAFTFDARGSANETNKAELNNHGINGAVSYLKPLSFGQLKLGMGLGYDNSSRSGGLVDVVREAVRLDSAAVALANSFVDSGTITVVNSTNQILSSTTDANPVDDYRIFSTGATTYIERVVGGNIAPGETVFVTYQYQSGEKVVYATISQNFHASLDFLKHYSLYADYSDADVDEKEGSSSYLTPVQRSRAGFRFEKPFWYEMIILGGEAVREDQTDDFSPYERKTFDLYVQAELSTDSRLRVSARAVQQDNLLSNEDIDLERQSARLSTHPWPRSSLAFEISHEKDTGGTIPRRLKEISLIGHWRFRKLVMELDGRSITEIQGDNEREHNLLTARLKREF